jgi:hypothetical protein
MSAQLSHLPKPTARIADWRIWFVGGVPRLVGRVVHHHSAKSGQVIVTSAVDRIDFVNHTAETQNTSYSLGHPSSYAV